MTQQRRRGRRRARSTGSQTLSTLGAFGALAVAGLGVVMVAKSISGVSVTSTFPGGPVSGTAGAGSVTVDGVPRTPRIAPEDLLPLPPSAAPTPTPTPKGVATVDITATKRVTYLEVAVPGGATLFRGELPRGYRLVYTEQRLEVVVGDTSAVRVLVNGKERRLTGIGGRETFVASRG